MPGRTWPSVFQVYSRPGDVRTVNTRGTLLACTRSHARCTFFLARGRASGLHPPALIAAAPGQGVTLSAHDPPCRCAHLMHDRSERRGVRDSFSFGPSPLVGGHHAASAARCACPRRPFRAHRQGLPGQQRTPSPHDRRVCAASPWPRALHGLRARSPCRAAPAVRRLPIGSRFTRRASSPRPVTLAPLRFAGFAVASLRADSHPQEHARRRRTKKGGANAPPEFASREGHPRRKALSPSCDANIIKAVARSDCHKSSTMVPTNRPACKLALTGPCAASRTPHDRFPWGRQIG